MWVAWKPWSLQLVSEVRGVLWRTEPYTCEVCTNSGVVHIRIALQPRAMLRIGFFFFFKELSPFLLHNASLSLISSLVMKLASSGINMATPDFFWLVLACSVFLPSFTFNLSVSDFLVDSKELGVVFLLNPLWNLF